MVAGATAGLMDVAARRCLATRDDGGSGRVRVGTPDDGIAESVFVQCFAGFVGLPASVSRRAISASIL